MVKDLAHIVLLSPHYPCFLLAKSILAGFWLDFGTSIFVLKAKKNKVGVTKGFTKTIEATQ